MMECERGPAPELLKRDGPDLTKTYIARRSERRSHQFKWPESLRGVVHGALAEMTDQRCAYCDLYPNPGGNYEIDHFRPKSRTEFYHLVCNWENLFLSCTACNKAKGNVWDKSLLQPDEPGFTFLRYFTYRTDTGKLEPFAGASIADQHRAKRTIEILDLKRPCACIMRQDTIKRIRAAVSDDDLAILQYRYLIPLCRTTPHRQS